MAVVCDVRLLLHTGGGGGDRLRTSRNTYSVVVRWLTSAAVGLGEQTWERGETAPRLSTAAGAGLAHAIALPRSEGSSQHPQNITTSSRLSSSFNFTTPRYYYCLLSIFSFNATCVAYDTTETVCNLRRVLRHHCTRVMVQLTSVPVLLAWMQERLRSKLPSVCGIFDLRLATASPVSVCVCCRLI